MRIVTVKVGLSQRERLKRKLGTTLGVLCLLSGIGLFVYGITQGTVPPPLEYVVPGAVLATFALTYVANTYTFLDAVRIDENYVWLKGAKTKFLESLPQLPRS